MMAGYGQFSGCECCKASGPFDFYGQCSILNSPPTNDLFWRSPSVIPAGETLGSYLSIDEGWFVDYDSGGTNDEAAIRITMAVMRTDMEKCWAARNGNLDHPEATYSAELLTTTLDTWTVGADGEYHVDGRLVSTEDTAATALAYIKTSVTIADERAYVLEVTAKADQVEHLRVSISNVVGSTEYSFVADLTSHSGADEVADAGDGFYTYRGFFIADMPAGGSDLEIRLVDSGGSTIEVAASGDGAYVASASLRRTDEEGINAGWDVSRVDAGELEIEYGPTYVRRRRVDPTNHRAPETIVEEGLVSGSVPSRRAGIVRPIDFPSTLLAIESWRDEHFAIDRAWSNSTTAGFIDLGGYSLDAYAVDAYVSYSSSTLGSLYWAFTDITLAEFPLFCTGDVEDHSPEYYKLPASFYSGAPRLPRIASCPPHVYPNVFSIQSPEYIYRDSQIDDWGSGSLPSQQHAEEFTLSQTVAIKFGPIVRTLYDVTIDCEIGPEQLPFFEGSGGTFWSETFEQARLWEWTIGGFGGGSATSPDVRPTTVSPHCWINLIMADAYGTSLSEAAAIWVYTEAEYTTTGVVPFHYPYIDTDIGDKPSSTITGYTHTLYLKLGAATPITHQIWRDEQAYPTIAGDEVWYSGLAAVQQTESAQGVAARWVYFERLWDTEPTESTPGVGRGWRMHVANASGVDLWTLDSDQDQQTPDCVATSDRFLYVIDFELCDTRMIRVGGTGRQVASRWAISHDGEVMWPTREVAAVAGEDASFALVNATPGAGNGNSAIDSIKNSDRLPLVPSLADWPDRLDVGYVDELLPQPITDPSCDVDADYAADYLSVATAAATDAAQLIHSFTREGFQRYRLIVEAKADDIEHLLVRIVDLHDDDGLPDAGDHAYMRVNLTAGTVASSGYVVSTSAEDLGGGRHRFTMYADADDDATASTCTVEVRLVDSGSDEIDGDAGDGAFVYTWSLSSRCKDTV